MSVMQNSFYVHTKYENMGEIYLYPIWEFLIINSVDLTSFKDPSSSSILILISLD